MTKRLAGPDRSGRSSNVPRFRSPTRAGVIHALTVNPRIMQYALKLEFSCTGTNSRGDRHCADRMNFQGVEWTSVLRFHRPSGKNPISNRLTVFKRLE
jgi:hypothetical protein